MSGSKMRLTWRSCGHPKTPTNTTKSGYPQCRLCKQADARRARERKKRSAALRDAAFAQQEAIALYRTEKAKRDERRKLNPQMTEAQRAFAAILERDRQNGRGGRPKGSRNGQHYAAKPGKPKLNLTRDPADALLDALGRYEGAA